MKSFLKRALAIILAATFVCTVPTVYADGNAEVLESFNTMTGDQTAKYLKELIQYIGNNTRDEAATNDRLCYEALMGIMKARPDLFETAVDSMMDFLDEYSIYMPPEKSEYFYSQLESNFEGIGVTILQQDDKFIVNGVLPGAAAEKAGIKAGDVFVTVDGRDVTGMALEELTSIVRGPVGTTVTLGLYREGIDGVLTISVVRDVIHDRVLDVAVLGEGETKTLYLGLPTFSDGCSTEIEMELNNADAEGIKNVILDLRNNSGGIFEEAIKIANLFLPEGKVIVSEDKKVKVYNKKYMSDNKRNKKYNTLVMINENSASASEVLTAALTENKAATALGVRSFGKGTVQNIVPLNTGASVKFTVAYYLTPLGNNINKVGIEPDIVVENEYVPLDITPYTEFEYKNVWSKGDVSPEVKYAKEMLSVWGLYTGAKDEVFNRELEDAIFVFQGAMGLYPYGVLDLTTQIAIYNNLKTTKDVIDKQLDEALKYFNIKIEE